MKLYENIRKRRIALNITQEELASMVGYTGKSMISKVERGEVDISQSKIAQFAAALKTTSNALFGNENEINIFILYPIIGAVSAGYNGIAYEEMTDTEQIPADWVKGDSPDSFFVLQVKGDSMYPLFMDGDRVLVHKTSSVDSGSIAVVAINGDEGTLKRVVYKRGEEWLELQAVNTAYPPKRIEGAALAECHVLGEVKKLIRNF